MTAIPQYSSPGFFERIRRLCVILPREEKETFVIIKPKSMSSLENERMARLESLEIKRDLLINKMKSLRQEIQTLMEELDKFEVEQNKKKSKLFKAYLDRRNSDTSDGSEETDE
ncbi:hypothetical protein XELAEV_18026557mg [Xenopus laevis]|uniref:Uncharacterized protein n=1 Tax=Xenopus laevis TaxID=8355 RepID=A0A974CUL7_XENLA|nr:hypothetical protein XELAEV_18026557mg [Xenopus laevis]